jgi:FO synthase
VRVGAGHSVNGCAQALAALLAPARQRTTEYGSPSAERMATARSDEGRRALTLELV